MKAFIAMLAVIAGIGQAAAQPAENPDSGTRTMASLLADGYEPAMAQLFKDKIWMRRGDGQGLAFICDRGRLGTATFDAYREQKFEQISCSVAR